LPCAIAGASSRPVDFRVGRSHPHLLSATGNKYNSKRHNIELHMENKSKFSPNPKLKLMNQVREVLRYLQYAYQTEKTYCRWIRRYIHVQSIFTCDLPCPRHDHFLPDQKPDVRINNQDLTSIWIAAAWLRNFFKKDNEGATEKRRPAGKRPPIKNYSTFCLSDGPPIGLHSPAHMPRYAVMDGLCRRTIIRRNRVEKFLPVDPKGPCRQGARTIYLAREVRRIC